MTMSARLTIVSIPLLAALVVSPAWATARAAPGTQVENAEFKTIAGGKERFLSNKVKANIFVFFRTNHERSLDALKQMAVCEKEFEGKPVRWVAVVSGSEPTEDVKAMVAQTGIKMPVLVDDVDALYNSLGIRLHPMVGLVDAKGKLLAIEEYRQIQYCDVIRMRIQIALGDKSEADLVKLENPEKGAMPGEEPAKKARRDVNMARRLFEIGQFEKAIERAKKAIELAPVAEGFALQAVSYARLGKCAEANQLADQALKLSPNDAWAADAKKACEGK